MNKPKSKKYTLSLSEHEMRRLTAYASANGITRPTAIHRIVSQALQQYAVEPSHEHNERQLGLFDSVQIDIFSNTCIANNRND